MLLFSPYTDNHVAYWNIPLFPIKHLIYKSKSKLHEDNHLCYVSHSSSVKVLFSNFGVHFLFCSYLHLYCVPSSSTCYCVKSIYTCMITVISHFYMKQILHKIHILQKYPLLGYVKLLFLYIVQCTI